MEKLPECDKGEIRKKPFGGGQGRKKRNPSWDGAAGIRGEKKKPP